MLRAMRSSAVPASHGGGLVTLGDPPLYPGGPGGPSGPSASDHIARSDRTSRATQCARSHPGRRNHPERAILRHFRGGGNIHFCIFLDPSADAASFCPTWWTFGQKLFFAQTQMSSRSSSTEVD